MARERSVISVAGTLKHDRLIVLLGIALVIILAWTYLVKSALAMSQATMTQMMSWGAAEFVSLFIMWAIMMMAMMLPSAIPMILRYERLAQKRDKRPVSHTAMFVAGYATVWVGFSLLATSVQWVLHSRALLSHMMDSTNTLLSGALLLGAGLYQWSPYKHACLHHCRAPLGYSTAEWRAGAHGAFVMGLGHGLNCLGSCWALMALLFALGVMNLWWVALLTVLVLAEKLLLGGHWLGRFAGLVFVGWGALLLSGYMA